MNMDLKYINHRGAELDLSDWPLVLQSDSLFDYEWQYNATNTGSQGGSISSFYRDVSVIEAALCVYSTSNVEFAAAMNRFFDVVETDVAATRPGRLVLPDNYYFPCYIVASHESGWRQGIRTNMKGIKIVSEYPWWCLNVDYSFGPNSDAAMIEYDFLDYPVDYDIDYSVFRSIKFVQNNSIEPANFRMVIFGPVENPVIRIGENIYQIEIQLYANEWVTIDSRDRTIIYHHAAGYDEPAFNSRQKAVSIFNPIPTGFNVITEVNCFFNITIYEGRSAPIWTL